MTEKQNQLNMTYYKRALSSMKIIRISERFAAINFPNSVWKNNDSPHLYTQTLGALLGAASHWDVRNSEKKH